MDRAPRNFLNAFHKFILKLSIVFHTMRSTNIVAVYSTVYPARVLIFFLKYNFVFGTLDQMLMANNVLKCDYHGDY